MDHGGCLGSEVIELPGRALWVSGVEIGKKYHQTGAAALNSCPHSVGFSQDKEILLLVSIHPLMDRQKSE